MTKLGAQQKNVSHRLMALFALRRLHAVLAEDERAEELRPLDESGLRVGATIQIGSYRHALHAFADLREGRLVMGCLLPLRGAVSKVRTIESRVEQLPKRRLGDGALIRTTIGPKSLDTWVAANLEAFTDESVVVDALDRLITAAAEAFTALSTLRPVRRSTPPPRHPSAQLPLFAGEDPDPPLDLPILTPVE